MKFKDLELYIYSAIENRYCTLSQITKFIATNVGGDILDCFVKELLDAMILDSKLVLANNSIVSGYFVTDRVPPRFALAGDGTLTFIHEGNPNYTIEPPPVPADEENLFSYEKEFYVFHGFTEKDYFDMEFHAGNGLKLEQIADEMRIPRSVLAQAEKTDECIAAALENGANVFYLKNAETVIRQCGEAGYTAVECAAALKTDAVKFNALLEKIPQLKIAWETGIKNSQDIQPDSTTPAAVSEKPKQKLKDYKTCDCGNPKIPSSTKCVPCWRKDRELKDAEIKPAYETAAEGKPTLLGVLDAIERRQEDIQIQTEVDAKQHVDHEMGIKPPSFHIARDEYQKELAAKEAEPHKIYIPDYEHREPETPLKPLIEYLTGGSGKPFVIEQNALLKIALEAIYMNEPDRILNKFTDGIINQFLNQLKENGV